MAPFFLTSFGFGIGGVERIFGGNNKQMRIDFQVFRKNSISPIMIHLLPTCTIMHHENYGSSIYLGWFIFTLTIITK